MPKFQLRFVALLLLPGLLVQSIPASAANPTPLASSTFQDQAIVQASSWFIRNIWPRNAAQIHRADPPRYRLQLKQAPLVTTEHLQKGMETIHATDHTALNHSYKVVEGLGLRVGETLLSIGGADSELPIHLSAALAGIHVLAVDSNKDAVERLRTAAYAVLGVDISEDLVYLDTPLEKTNLPSSIDAILLLNVLDAGQSGKHASDVTLKSKRGIMLKIFSVIKEDGIIAVSSYVNLAKTIAEFTEFAKMHGISLTVKSELKPTLPGEQPITFLQARKQDPFLRAS